MTALCRGWYWIGTFSLTYLPDGQKQLSMPTSNQQHSYSNETANHQ
ncbi:hypothetical protein NF868_12655 [Bacillus zhangzhouensis]|nr:hypothetical protein NF868_12655 [Bacillus zhangzhouensis]